MITRHGKITLVTLVLTLTPGVRAQTPATPAFTYQGVLKEGGSPANGQYDMLFSLVNAESGGNLIGQQVLVQNVTVTNGLFTVLLNENDEFGPDAYSSEARWLTICIKPAGSPLQCEPLSPAQPITRAPAAQYAAKPWTDSGASLSYMDGSVGIGVANPSPSAKLSVGGPVRILEGDTGLTELQFFTAAGGGAFMSIIDDYKLNMYVSPYLSSTLTLDGSSGANGRVGVRNSSPGCSLHVGGGIRARGGLPGGFGANDNGYAFSGNGGDDDSGMYSSANGQIEFFTNAAERMRINSIGNIGIGTDAPQARLDVKGEVMIDPRAIANSVLTLAMFGGPPGQIVGNYTDGSLRLRVAGSDQVTINGFGRVGIGVTSPTEKLDVNGAIRIRGGSDLAEPFNVHGERVEPGMVVAIDERNAGEMRIADKPFDPAVAGIISGANGVKPGLTLQQEGTIADGKHPVALSGRVFCRVDADANGPIKIGDLLTTSSRPGHAMRVGENDDPPRGSIIGKAMTKLDRGQGLVLVLVNLQ